MTKYDETLSMLKELTDAKGVPGNEREPREIMRKYIEPYADEMLSDNLGSLIAKKTGKDGGPKVMVAGHLDLWLLKLMTKDLLNFKH
jgi:putative aminopeptidase FrvX